MTPGLQQFGTPDDDRGVTRARRRSWWVFGALVVGMRVSSWVVGASAPWLGAAVAVLGASWWCFGRGGARGWRWVAWGTLLLGVGLIGAGWFSLRVHETARDALDVVAAAQGREVLIGIEGTALGRPEGTEREGFLGEYVRFGEASWGFDVRVRRALLGTGDDRAPAWRRVSGVLRVRGSGPAARVGPGERVRATGWYSRVRGAKNPGEADWRRWARMEGRAGTLDIGGAGTLEVVAGGGGAIGVSLGSVRAAALAALRDALGGRGRGVVEAIVLGDRGGLGPEVDRAFARQGLVHLLAISGLHVGLLAGMVLLCVRVVGDAGRWEYAIVVGVVVGYALLVPSRAPVVRAALVITAFALASWSGRRYDGLGLLGWAACATALWRPLDVGSMGFVLSFGVTAGLIWIGPRVAARVRPFHLRGVRERRAGPLRRAWLGAGRRGREALVFNLVAWVVSQGVVAAWAGVFSPVAWLATLVATPLVAAVLALGVGATLAGLLGAFVPTGWFAGALGRGAGWTGETLVGVVGWLDGIAGLSWRAAPVGIAWVIAATGLGVWALLRWRPRVREGVVLVGGLVVIVSWYGLEARAGVRWALSRGSGVVAGSPVALRVDMLAVGDGSCLLVRSGDEAMLWDCGGSSSDVGVWTIPRAVRALGVVRVERVVVTHADLDHFVGLVDACEPIGVREVLVTDAFIESATRGGAPARTLAALGERGIRVRTLARGDVFSLGEATARVLNPAPGPRPEGVSDNDTSLVVEVRVPTPGGERGVLLTGDVGPAAIGALIDAEPWVRADVLELPHDGSYNAEAVGWVGALEARVVLQSTGSRRVGDERWSGAWAGRSWWVSDRDGSAFGLIRRDGRVESGSNVLRRDWWGVWR